MRSIRVERTIDAPIDRVFDVLTDHAEYKRFRGIKGSEMLTLGKQDPNGVGGVRAVDIGLLQFEEEITAFERPTRMDYLITKVNTPYEHEGASVRLEEADEGTHVVWTSSFRVPVPVVGRLIELPWSIALARGFRRVLEDTERELT